VAALQNQSLSEASETRKACGSMRLFDPGFRQFIGHYVIQSLMAALVLLIILATLEIQAHLVVIAAVGSSTFVVFAMPQAVQARPRSLIGGHLVGLFSGAICYLPFFWLASRQQLIATELLLALTCALAVGLAIFLMTITNTEHAPAAGTALGITVQSFSWTAVVFVVASVVGLSLARWLLRDWLRNLV